MTKDEEIQYLKEKVALYRFDYLTGLRQRADFEYDLRKKFELGLPFTLCYYDVDHLHLTNRKQGFAEGDSLLRQVANDIRHQPVPHTTYRTSGDEFYAICCGKPTSIVANSTSVITVSTIHSTVDAMMHFLDMEMIKLKEKKNTRRKDD